MAFWYAVTEADLQKRSIEADEDVHQVSNACNLGVREIQDSSASWRIVIGIGMAFSIPLLTVLILPESPRHLMGERKWDEARLAMARLRGVKGDTGNEFVERDFTEMYESLKEEENAGTGSWLECFTGEYPIAALAGSL